jgi:hypothetical protein
MVAVAVPGCAELAAVSVRTLPVADEAVLQPEVTPEGNPVMANVTFPMNPLRAITPTDDFSVPPGRRVRLPGAGASANDGAFTVTVTVVEEVTEPKVPVIVTVELPGVAELLATRVMGE